LHPDDGGTGDTRHAPFMSNIGADQKCLPEYATGIFFWWEGSFLQVFHHRPVRV
jgi:hypothetical protein